MMLIAVVLAVQAIPPAAPYRGNLTLELDMEPASVAATASADGELTVVAKRTYHARMKTYIDRPTRTRRCRQTAALGIAQLDARLCDTLLACMNRSPTRQLVRACVIEMVSADVKRMQDAVATKLSP